jgi:hypothetical protein
MRILLPLALCAGMLTAACATEAPYQQRSNDDRYGYAETLVQPNRLRVSYNGDTLTPRETVEDYLLYRSAEATLQHGFDYFVIVEHDVEENARFESTGVRARMGGVSYREVSTHNAMADIVMFQGNTPPPIANVYDARAVQHSLEARVIRAAGTH